MEILLIILATITFTVYIIVDAEHQANLIEVKRGAINHFNFALKVLILAFICSVFYYIIFLKLLSSISLLLYLLSFRWLIFDLLLIKERNKIREENGRLLLKYNYIPKVELYTSKLDKFLSNFSNPYYQFIIKGFLILLFLTLTILFL